MSITSHPNAENRAEDTFAYIPIKGPPRSGVIQNAGKELDPASTKFVPGAQPGLLALRFSRDECKAVASFPFVLFASMPLFNVYEPTVGTVQGGYVGTFKERPGNARWQADINGRRRCLPPDGNVVKESRDLYLIVGGRPVAFETHSSGLTPISDMLDRMARHTGTHPSEPKPIRGPFVGKWRMSTTERREGSHRWWTPNPELLGKLGEPGGPTIDEVRFARQARAIFLDGGTLWGDSTPAVEAPRAARLQEVTSGPPAAIDDLPPKPDVVDYPAGYGGGPVDEVIPF
jgi:hypothetical protein